MNVLNCLGVGTVARNKETNSDIAFVYPPGYFPAGDGEISGNMSEQAATGQTRDGNTHTSKVLSSNVVPAKWMNMNGGMRLTPPDVRVGSKVAIYRWGDDPTLHWTTVGFTGDTARLETVIFGVSGNPNTDQNNGFDYSNYYAFEISTHTGRVALRTSQANGEKTRHEIALNTKSGILSIADGENNLFAVDSMNHSFLFQNQEQTKFFLSKKMALLSTQDGIRIEALNQLTLQTKKLQVQAEQLTMIIPDIKIQGNIALDGGMTSTKGIESQGDITAGGISLMKHPHSGVQKGGDKTGLPTSS